MDPNEFDRYEELQQLKFRPASLNDVPEISKNLLDMIKSKKKIPSNSPEGKLNTRISNALKSNAYLRSIGSKEDFLKDLSTGTGRMVALACNSLKLDTNKGNTYQEKTMVYSFTDGSKATEKEAKQRLIDEFVLDSNKFILLPDAGDDAIYIDEKQNKLVRAGDVNERLDGRSIDAITENKHCVIAWVMKYAGGTAAVDGSGQKDQKTTEGIKYSKIFESAYSKGHEITYKEKPVFMAYLVYGGQFANGKRIVQNEIGFKRDYDCKRSFNISINQVKNVIEYLSKEKSFDNSLESLYNKYGYDIEYNGRPKQKELQRLKQWTDNTI